MSYIMKLEFTMTLEVQLKYTYHQMFMLLINLSKYKTLNKTQLLKFIELRIRIEYTHTIFSDVKLKLNMKQYQTALHYIG